MEVEIGATLPPSLVEAGLSIIAGVIQRGPSLDNREDPNVKVSTFCSNRGLAEAYEKITGHIPGITGCLPVHSEDFFLNDFRHHEDKATAVAALHQAGYKPSPEEAQELCRLEQEALQDDHDFEDWLGMIITSLKVSIRLFEFTSSAAEDVLGYIHLRERAAPGAHLQPGGDKVVYMYRKSETHKIFQLLSSRFFQDADDEQLYKDEYPIDQLLGGGICIDGRWMTAWVDPEDDWKYQVDDPSIAGHTWVWIDHKDRDSYWKDWRFKMVKQRDEDGAIKTLVDSTTQDKKVQEMLTVAKAEAGSSEQTLNTAFSQTKSDMPRTSTGEPDISMDATLVDDAAAQIDEGMKIPLDKFLRLTLVGAEGAGKTLLANAIINANMPPDSHGEHLMPVNDQDPVVSHTSLVAANQQEQEALALDALFPSPAQDESDWSPPNPHQLNNEDWLQHPFTTSAGGGQGCTAITQVAVMSPDQKVFQWTAEFINAYEVKGMLDHIKIYYSELADVMADSDDDKDVQCSPPSERTKYIICTLCGQHVADLDMLLDEEDYIGLKAFVESLRVPQMYREVLGKKVTWVGDTSSNAAAALNTMQSLSCKYTANLGSAALLKTLELQLPGQHRLVIYDTPGVVKTSMVHTEGCLTHLRKAAKINIDAGYPVHVVLIPLVKRSIPAELMELVFQDPDFISFVIQAPSCFKFVPLLVADNPNAGKYFFLDNPRHTADAALKSIVDDLGQHKYQRALNIAMSAAYKDIKKPKSVKQWLDDVQRMQMLQPAAVVVNTMKYSSKYAEVVEQYGLKKLLVDLMAANETDRLDFAFSPLAEMLKVFTYLSCKCDAMGDVDKKSAAKVQGSLSAKANLMDWTQISQTEEFKLFKQAVAPTDILEDIKNSLMQATKRVGSDLKQRMSNAQFAQRYGPRRTGLNVDIKQAVDAPSQAMSPPAPDQHPADSIIQFLCGGKPNEFACCLITTLKTTLALEVSNCKTRSPKMGAQAILPLLELYSPFEGSEHTAQARALYHIKLRMLKDHLETKISRTIERELSSVPNALVVEFYDAMLSNGLKELLRDALTTRKYRNNADKLKLFETSKGTLRNICIKAIGKVMVEYTDKLNRICDQVGSSTSKMVKAMVKKSKDWNLYATATYIMGRALIDQDCCTSSTALFQRALQALENPRVKSKLHICRVINALTIEELVQRVHAVDQNNDLRKIACDNDKYLKELLEEADKEEDAPPGDELPDTANHTIDPGRIASTSSAPPQSAVAPRVATAQSGNPSTSRTQDREQTTCAQYKLGRYCQNTDNLKLHKAAPSKTLKYCRWCRAFFTRTLKATQQAHALGADDKDAGGPSSPPKKRAKLQHK